MLLGVQGRLSFFMQDPTFLSRDFLETGSGGNVADLETARLLSAESCIPSYVSTTRGQGHCDNDNPSKNRRRNTAGSSMGKGEGSGQETPQSVATLNGSRPSSASPSTMDKTNRESEPRRARFCIALISKVSLTLKNSGSVARDHLALERTFLAYVRTSLGLVTAGVALVQLFMTAKPVNFNGTRFRVMIRALGASTVVLGLIVLAIGVIRYFSIQAALTTGMFPAARLSASAIAIAIAILTSVTLGIIMAGTKV